MYKRQIVESVEQVFKQGHERRRGHLREKAEHVRLLQAGALQDREQDALSLIHI